MALINILSVAIKLSDKLLNLKNSLGLAIFSVLNSNLTSIEYPYETYENVTLHGYISNKQNNIMGNSRYLIFIPCRQSPAKRFGVKVLKTVIIQGIAILRQNKTDQSGYVIDDIQQDYQGITISINSTTDISGYICDCVLDFYVVS